MLAVVGWTQPAGALVPWAAPGPAFVFLFGAPLWRSGCPRSCWEWHFRSGVLPGWSLWAAFILGWVFQFIGHAVYEGKSPAFAKNAIHVLVGPMWILQELAFPRRSRG